MSTALIAEAPTVWNLLNGVLCVYKSAGETAYRVRQSLLFKLCTELNELECRPPAKYVTISYDAQGNKKVAKRPSYADHPLVVGPRYQPQDLKCSWSTFLGVNTSGVFVLGLNNGTKKAYSIHNSHPMRTYILKGRFGYATDNLHETGKVVDKSSFKHIRRASLEKLLSTIQSSHQRQMFELCGVDIQSQEAYNLAAQGLIRPTNSKLPLIYGIKCIHFEPPDFSIEVHCINEYEAFLLGLIHDIGIKLKSLAVCVGLQCIKHSYFTINQALLKKHWTLNRVIHNLANNNRLIYKQGELTKQINKLKTS